MQIKIIISQIVLTIFAHLMKQRIPFGYFINLFCKVMAVFIMLSFSIINVHSQNQQQIVQYIQEIQKKTIAFNYEMLAFNAMVANSSSIQNLYTKSKKLVELSNQQLQEITVVSKNFLDTQLSKQYIAFLIEQNRYCKNIEKICNSIQINQIDATIFLLSKFRYTCIEAYKMQENTTSLIEKTAIKYNLKTQKNNSLELSKQYNYALAYLNNCQLQNIRCIKVYNMLVASTNGKDTSEYKSNLALLANTLDTAKREIYSHENDTIVLHALNRQIGQIDMLRKNEFQKILLLKKKGLKTNEDIIEYNKLTEKVEKVSKNLNVIFNARVKQYLIIQNKKVENKTGLTK